MSFKYKVSIIYTSSNNVGENKKTLDMVADQLKKEDKLQVIFANLASDSKIKKEIESIANSYKNNTKIIEMANDTVESAYKKAMEFVEGEWFTVVDAGDKFDVDYIKNMYKYAKNNSKINVVSANKIIFDGASIVAEPYSDSLITGKTVVNLDRDPKVVPMCFAGTLLKSSILDNISIKPDLGFDAENEFFCRVALENRKVAVLGGEEYFCNREKDYMFRRFLGLYDKKWYIDSIDDFMVPMLLEAKKKYDEIPTILQYLMMGFVMHRLEGNMDNRNKHVFSEDEAKEYIQQIRKVLVHINDRYILNMHEVAYYTINPYDMRMFLQIKYDDYAMKYDVFIKKKELNMVQGDVAFFSTNNMRMNIMFMEYFDGKLEIDASYPDFFVQDNIKVYATLNNKRYECVEEEDYSLTKYFGLAAYKRVKIHTSIPLSKKDNVQHLVFIMEYDNEEFIIMPEYKSHTSRLSGRLEGMYWKFDDFVAYHDKTQITIQKAKRFLVLKKELSMAKELLTTTTYGTYCLKVLFLRELYWLTRPLYKRKRIWMFYDKIYKGGDSSEYIYKYAKKQKDKIKKYYLLDKKACDYKRMKKEGYRPLKRGTLKHKLVFMNADMVIASNSTVFAFNDFPMGASAYFRGTFDFHVACVQHGMSVQKIAIAQKRLRDNTRLYFCASKYEIENLSKPIYNYNGYNALKLTGVPRYDGLVDEAEKQIMIAPTWRMQSAMLVVKNEGVQRDYNSNFKETSYYKVFNSLINDKRLIDAAKKYGYRIKYVLHPIVSPQVNDFDKNDYVDIISAIGDMSYEDLFRKSSLMVTDFSGIQFDFAYMRKPLVYLHHDDIPQHYEEGTYHYDTMAFGEICHNNNELIDLLCEYMKNGCVMKEEYKKRADDFFEYDDHNNCERIYKEMIKYQRERIDILKGRVKNK